MSIRNKLVFAYGLLFVAAIGGMGVVAMQAVSGAVEHQFAVQAANAANLVSYWNPPQPLAFVANVIRRVYGADVAVRDGQGRWGSTLEAGPRAAVEEANRAGLLSPAADAARVIPWTLADERATFAVAVSYRPGGENLLEGAAPSPGGVMILFFPAAQVEEEIARARRPLLAVVLAGLVLVAGLGIAIAHSITRPLGALAARTREVAAGHWETAGPAGPRPETAPPGPDADPDDGDEVARLAGAFDRMVDGLRRSQAELLRSERLAVAGRMAAGIAHEIRNPLAAMRMTVELHAREEMDAEHRQSLDLLRTEIGRIEEAVAELMDLANPAPPRREPVDLGTVVQEVLSLVRSQADHQGIVVDCRLPATPRVAADPRSLRRVVLNLVLNAIQAMPDRGRLTVSTGVSPPGPRTPGGAPQPGPAVRLDVQDTGSGIPAELRERVFDPFVSGKAGGAGLGLAVTKRIVEEHLGRIGFETGAQGTRFWVELRAEGPPS